MKDCQSGMKTLEKQLKGFVFCLVRCRNAVLELIGHTQSLAGHVAELYDLKEPEKAEQFKATSTQITGAGLACTVKHVA